MGGGGGEIAGEERLHNVHVNKPKKTGARGLRNAAKSYMFKQ